MTTLTNSLGLEPISRAEITHLTRTGVSRRWQTLAVVIGALLAVSMALTISITVIVRSDMLMTPLVQDVWTALTALLRAINLALFFLVFAVQALLTLQALMLASDAIARERQNGTWDLLILTERGARQIVMGKWRAVRTYLFHTHRNAILLRVVVVLWLGISAVSGGLPQVPTPYYSTTYGSSAYGGQISSSLPLPDPVNLAFVSALVLIYSFFDMALAAAVGLASAVHTRRGMAFATAGAAYLGAMILMFSPLPLVAPMRFFAGSLWFYVGRIGLALTPLDGGAVLAFRLVSAPGFYGYRWLPMMQRIALNLALFILVIAFMLWLARRLARRQGAMAERKVKEVPSAEYRV